MPMGLDEKQLRRIDEIVAKRRKVERGAPLFSDGETFSSLYAIRTGFFKTCVTTEDGREQVTGFQMAGEIIGLDGIVSDRYTCNAVALEDAEVCVMPFDRLEEMSREITALQHHVHKIMSREIVREHGVMLLLGQHARRGASRCLSVESRPAVACSWLLAHRDDPAYVPGGDRQLFRNED